MPRQRPRDWHTHLKTGKRNEYGLAELWCGKPPVLVWAITDSRKVTTCPACLKAAPAEEE